MRSNNKKTIKLFTSLFLWSLLISVALGNADVVKIMGAQINQSSLDSNYSKTVLGKDELGKTKYVYTSDIEILEHACLVRVDTVDDNISSIGLSFGVTEVSKSSSLIEYLKGLMNRQFGKSTFIDGVPNLNDPTPVKKSRYFWFAEQDIIIMSIDNYSRDLQIGLYRTSIDNWKSSLGAGSEIGLFWNEVFDFSVPFEPKLKKSYQAKRDRTLRRTQKSPLPGNDKSSHDKNSGYGFLKWIIIGALLLMIAWLFGKPYLKKS